MYPYLSPIHVLFSISISLSLSIALSFSGSVKAITDEVTACAERLTELQRQRQGLQAGCDADSKEGEKSLADQLKDAKTRVSTADTELKHQKKRLEHLKVELKERSKGAHVLLMCC